MADLITKVMLWLANTDTEPYTDQQRQKVKDYAEDQTRQIRARVEALETKYRAMSRSEEPGGE